MNTVRLADLADWPIPDASQGRIDRFRLLSTVTVRLGVVSHRPSHTEWDLAAIPVDKLGEVRDAVETEGQATERRRVAMSGRYNWRTVRRHPARACQQLLARIDRHIPGER